MKKNSYPKYWEKRFKRMNDALVKLVEDTAKAEPLVTDEFGEYKPGTFLYGACVVTVMIEEKYWSAHIYSEEHVSLKTIQEIRRKYLPDAKSFVMVFGPRKEEDVDGIILFELPVASKEEE